MPLPEFTIEPWEMPFCDLSTPPSAPAMSHVEVRHGDQLQKFSLRCVKGWPHDLVFFSRDEENAPNQVVVDAPLYKAVRDGIPVVAAHLKGVLEGQRWFRMLSFDSHSLLATPQTANAILFLHAQGTQMWTNLNVSTRDAVRFHSIFTCAEIESLSPQLIYNRIADELKDSSSDCAFALKWLKLSWPERIRPLIHLNNGTLEEMQKVLAWIAWSIYDFPSSSEATWRIRIEYSTDLHMDDEAYEDTELNYELDINGQHVNPSTNALRLHRLIQKSFDPRFVASIAHKHKAVQHLLRTSALFWSFGFSSPSHHERLEARLQLRQWLQDKVAPEEIPHLLGEQ